MDGFVKADSLSWDAYNENSDLPKQVETYKKPYGYYPELVQKDKTYPTNDNRNWCKERTIGLTATLKEQKKDLAPYQKRKL